jgi:Flp pilus assembly protein TadD
MIQRHICLGIALLGASPAIVSLACFAGMAAQASTSIASSEIGASSSQLDEAKVLIDKGDFKAAASLLSVYVRTQTTSSEGHRLLAYSYLRLGQPKLSLEEYTRAAAIKGPTPADLRNVAKDYVLADDMVTAEHWARTALDIDQKDPESWYELGRIHYTEQHFQEAANCFKQALVLLPGSIRAENNLGLAYEGLNRGDDAVHAYRQAIEWQKSEPRPDEQPLLNLGIMLVHQGKLDEAYGLLSEAAKIAPRDPRIREELGHLCLQSNKGEEAQRQLEEAVTLDPTKASSHFLLGRAYHLQGQELKSRSEFALAASLSGTNP